MKQPSGKDLLNTLVNLLAMQEGVKIKYEIIEGEGSRNEKKN